VLPSCAIVFRVIAVRDERGELLALADESRVWFAPSIDVLEPDHPRRRFAGMLALAAALMQTEPDAEPYDPQKAAYYARYILIPDTAFIVFRERESDAELAERFNVPLEEIAAKQIDLAVRRQPVA
jgi:hypothetical protein